MSHNILLTGSSGYLGGDVLAAIGDYKLPAYNKLYSMVRSPEQAEKVKEYGAEPLMLDVQNTAALHEEMITKEISVVFFLIDAMFCTAQVHFIEALSEVKKKTGREVHFLHTSGAKLFSSSADCPTDRILHDTDPDLYKIQKGQVPELDLPKAAVGTNNTILEKCEELGVYGYIFIPCIVYGQGRGFGKTISIQNVALVKAAIAVKKMYRVDKDITTWPVCHIHDNTSLYLSLLSSILDPSTPPPPHGIPGNGGSKSAGGYYLASTGKVSWSDLSKAMAVALHSPPSSLLEDSEVHPFPNDSPEESNTLLSRMAVALDNSPPEYVKFQIGGQCNLEARNAAENLPGWGERTGGGEKGILEGAAEEVEHILRNIDVGKIQRGG